MRAFLLALLLACHPEAPPGTPATLPATPAAVPAAEDLAPWEGRWRIVWHRPGGWRPPTFHGTVDLRRSPSGWEGGVTFAESTGVPVLQAADVKPETARLTFGFDNGMVFALDLFRDGPDVHGSARWLDASGGVSVPWSEVTGRQIPPTDGPLVAAGFPASFPTATPAEVGLDDAAVRAIAGSAAEELFSGFVLVKDGKLVIGAGTAPDERVNVASVAKALSSLAVPYLLAEGRWPSVDAPIGPALGWAANDPRAAITLRHVLSHTTGLETPPYVEWVEAAAADYRTDLQGAKLAAPPGTRYAYSNRTAELTSEVVAFAAG